LIDTLAIVGDGLIGRSIQLAWRRRHPEARVLAFDRGDDLAPLAGADAVVLAAPVDAISALIPRVRRLAPRAGLITDTGSTKTAIQRAAAGAGLSGFVAGHPMAGGTTTGPDAARPDLFDGRTWFLLTRGSDAAAIEAARSLVTDLGARPVLLDDDGSAHDALVAAISHLPQVVATALRARVGETVGADGLRHAGGGLRDTTRLADSHASMWAPILEANAAAIAPLLKDLARDLERLADAIGDRAAVERAFARAHRFPLSHD
jgi:prephenate dehydrogenase